MTSDWESLIERAEPFGRTARKTLVFIAKFAFGCALTLIGGLIATLAATRLRLPDAALLLQHSGRAPVSVSALRNELMIIMTVAVGVLITGLHTLDNLFRSHEDGQRIAELELRLREAEHRADAAAIECAADTEWMREALGAAVYLFSIPGVVEAARKATRKALHPDAHPEASADELRDLTERFQMAEAVFDRFSN